MELSKGYKQTEVGVVPEDWHLKTVEEIFIFYPTSNYSKAQMSLDGEIGCIHYGLIHAIPNSSYNVKKGIKYYINKEQAKYETIKDGDVVMVDASEDLEGVNKSVELLGIDDKKFIAGLHTFLLRDTNSYLANGYRGTILNSSIVKSQLLRLAVGMKVYGVSKPQLKSVLIPVPPLSEQLAIANALSDMDALISSLEQLIEKKKAIKQGAMQELLKPKDGWVTKKLGEILIGARLGGNYSNTNKTTDYPLIKMGNIGRGQIILDKLEYIQHGVQVSESDRLVIGDLLFNTRNTLELVGKVSIWRNEIHKAYYNSNLMKLTFNPNYIISTVLANAIFNSRFVINQLSDIATGTTSVAAIYTRDLMNITFHIPPLNAQMDIVQKINDLDSDIEAQKGKLSKAILVKQGAMQSLLIGKIRLV